MKRIVTLGLALALGACGSRDPQQPAAPIDDVQLNAIASTGPTVAEVLAQGNDAPPAAPDRKPRAFDYLGDWSVDPKLCHRNRWRFTKTTVEVDGGNTCTIDASEPRTDSEMKLTMTCGARTGYRTGERWSLVRRANGDLIVARTTGNGIPRSVTLGKCA